MKRELRETVELLRKRVASNLELIRYNDEVCKEILATQPPSSERSEKLSEGYGINKKYLNENRESLKLQMAIIKFLSDFGQQLALETIATVGEESAEEIFRKTVEGELPFNNLHPFFADEAFFDRLMEYYIDKEHFEKCAELQQSRLMAN